MNEEQTRTLNDLDSKFSNQNYPRKKLIKEIDNLAHEVYVNGLQINLNDWLIKRAECAYLVYVNKNNFQAMSQPITPLILLNQILKDPELDYTIGRLSFPEDTEYFRSQLKNTIEKDLSMLVSLNQLPSQQGTLPNQNLQSKFRTPELRDFNLIPIRSST
jgi:hypothetical protein